MSKISFKDPNSTTAPEAEQVTVSTPVDGVTIDCPTTAVATVSSGPPAVRAQAPLVYDDENIGFDDILLPRLNIVQKVGEMSNTWTPGEIVLNQQAPIFSPTKTGSTGTDPLTITVFGFQKTRYAEKVIGGAKGAIVDTREGVAKLGGTLDYQEWEAKKSLGVPVKLFQPLATALVFIERPAHIQDADNLLFPYNFQEKQFALALWSMKGTAYTNAAKHMFTARKIGHLREGGYPSFTYRLSTELKKYGSENFAHIPVLKPGTRNSPEFVAFLKDVLGANA